MSSILDLAVPLSNERPWIKMVLHGPPGSGKTYFAANAPEPVFIDFERSTETLRAVPGREHTPVVRPKTFSEVRAFVKEAPKKFETIVIDTVSSMQTFYMREYMVEVERKEIKNRPDRSRYMPYQGDYRYATNELTEFWLELQEMSCHVIFVAHTKEITNEDGNVVGKVPLLSPAVRDSISQFINVIGYLERKANGVTKTVDRLLYLNATNIIQAKNRLGIQEESIKNPNFEELFGNGN